MDPDRFLKSIYLGDRACRSMLVDFWSGELKVQVDCISRVRSETWDYYNDENLDDGFIVFEGVHKFSLDPEGLLPNDCILGFTVKPSDIPECSYLFELRMARGEAGRFSEITLAVFCNGVALEPSGSTGVRIRT